MEYFGGSPQLGEDLWNSLERPQRAHGVDLPKSRRRYITGAVSIPEFPPADADEDIGNSVPAVDLGEQVFQIVAILIRVPVLVKHASLRWRIFRM